MATADLTPRRVPIFGFEDRYEVDENGRVFSIARTGIRSDGAKYSVNATERLPQTNSKNGYQQICLSLPESKSRCFNIHRLVAEAFLPKPDDSKKLEVNHKNGIRSDNRASNLEWVSRSENNTHKYRVLGAKHPFAGKRAELSSYSIPIVGIDDNGVEVVRFPAMKEAGRAGFTAPAICRCLGIPNRKHRGLRWEKANPPTLEASSS